MDKRYQVFVSSTFLDLKEERAGITKAILDLGHIPAGMELFPASPTSQLDYIKRIIDDCDYYVLVVGGRYGSIDDNGLSYTEQEFEYALSKQIPVLAFVHSDIGKIKSENVDHEENKKKKLEVFRKRVLSNRVVKLWEDLNDLQSKVIVSLTSEFRENPRIGWRRDDGSISNETQEQLDKIKASRDHWLNSLRESEVKLKAYEALENAKVEIRFESDDGPRSVEVHAGNLIKEFAFRLQHGLDPEDISDGLFSLIQHKFDGRVTSINRESVNNAGLFFEVFEIAKRNERTLTIAPGKKWLLKAAFTPFEQIIAEASGGYGGYGSYDEEIPF